MLSLQTDDSIADGSISVLASGADSTDSARGIDGDSEAEVEMEDEGRGRDRAAATSFTTNFPASGAYGKVRQRIQSAIEEERVFSRITERYLRIE